MPDRSGLPSAARGAGALRFGCPAGVRGTPAVGYGGHCAESEGPLAAPITVAASAWSSVFMKTHLMFEPLAEQKFGAT
jgi:hypothetical protein